MKTNKTVSINQVREIATEMRYIKRGLGDKYWWRRAYNQALSDLLIKLEELKD